MHGAVYVEWPLIDPNITGSVGSKASVELGGSATMGAGAANTVILAGPVSRARINICAQDVGLHHVSRFDVFAFGYRYNNYRFSI